MIAVAFGLFGVAIASVILRRSGMMGAGALRIAAGYGPGLGLGIVSLSFFLSRFAGAAPGLVPILVGSAAVLTTLIAATSRNPESTSRRTSVVPSRFSWVVLAILLVLEVAACLHWAATRPLGSYDARAIWNVRALFMYRAEGNVGKVFSSMEHGQPDYPLLVPGTVAGGYTILGRETPVVPQGMGLIWAFGLSLLVLGASLRRSEPDAGGWTLLLLFSTPVFWAIAFTQCADIPVAYLFLGSALGLASLLKPRGATTPPVMTGFFLGCLMFTKNEGVVYALVLAAVFTLVGGVRAITRRQIGELVVGAAWPLVTFFLFKFFWAPTNSVAPFLEGGLARALQPTRWQTVAGAMVDRILPGGDSVGWSLFWIVVILSLLMPVTVREIRLRPAVRFLTMTSAAALGFCVFVYLATPNELDWHMATSLDRVLFQIAPLVAVVWFPVALGSYGDDD
jgi:hypothetical protein